MEKQKGEKHNGKNIGFIKKKYYLVISVLYIYEKKCPVPLRDDFCVSQATRHCVPGVDDRAGVSEGAGVSMPPPLPCQVPWCRPGAGRVGSQGSPAQHNPCWTPQGVQSAVGIEQQESLEC